VIKTSLIIIGLATCLSTNAQSINYSITTVIQKETIVKKVSVLYGRMCVTTFEGGSIKEIKSYDGAKYETMMAGWKSEGFRVNPNSVYLREPDYGRDAYRRHVEREKAEKEKMDKRSAELLAAYNNYEKKKKEEYERLSKLSVSRSYDAFRSYDVLDSGSSWKWKELERGFEALDAGKYDTAKRHFENAQ
jgi:hypothetical protein